MPITLSTVGFTEVHPLSDPGHLFTIALIATGVSTAAYAVGTVGEYVIGGRLSGALRRQRMQHDIDRLVGHYIVRGYGRVGRQVVEELDARATRTVVVEPSDEPFPPQSRGRSGSAATPPTTGRSAPPASTAPRVSWPRPGTTRPTSS